MRRALLALAVLVLLAMGAVGSYVLYTRHAGRNIRGSPTVEFVPSLPAPTAAAPAPRNRRKREQGIVWPDYGYDLARTRSAPIRQHPPFRRVWTAGGSSLLEFPPAIAYGRLYLASNAGQMMAVNTATGRRAWTWSSHRCVAATPAVDDHTVFESFLNRPPCNAQRKHLDGEVVAFAAGFGKIRWRTRIGPTESSPLVANGRVYVGDWRGEVYALDERTGKVVWSFRTGGKVKGGVALEGHRLYVGSYDGHVYALDARTGKELWRVSSQPRLGRTGTFYSTPATAYDRVYVGSTDGKVYSFGALSGKIRWSHTTGGYVYGSPAVWNELVLVGSYDRYLYAFDAATGDVRWRFRTNGPISGSVTILDGVAYVATLKGRTYALAARTGKLLWSFPDGKYTPVVADSKRLYLVGYAKLYGMVER